MELEDHENEEISSKKKKFNPDRLREESEEWACQAQAYRNEVESMKAEMKSEVESKDQQIKILQKTLQGMQQQMLEAQKKSGELPGFLAEKNNQDLSLEDSSELVKPSNMALNSSSQTESMCEKTTSETLKTSQRMPEEDAKLVAIISTFLNVHPFGAGTEYIWSYLLKIDPSVKYQDVEKLMDKYPSCFTLEIDGVGASMSRKWKFTAFNPL